jgi:hypothetical protein
METFSAEDVVGTPYNPSSPVVKLQYEGAVYDNSIRIMPDTSINQLYHAAKSLASFSDDTVASLIRLDYQGELVTNPRMLKDGELLEIMKGSPENRKSTPLSLPLIFLLLIEMIR